MKHKDGKPINHPDKSSRKVPMALMFVVLCGFSFYLGGIFCSEKDKIVTQDVNKSVEPSNEKASGSLQIKDVTFPECSSAYQDYTPCTDPTRWRKYTVHRLSFMERHCTPVFEKKECLVPPPDGYKLPIKWPQSKNECWYRTFRMIGLTSKNRISIGFRKKAKSFFVLVVALCFPTALVNTST
ncbi:Methyltransferase [Castilleja foliolosa]|uniref:Methyltransferase n=1 Tax=Castilleja foliolosa TaxID=1961234 RepID=A0ABD3DBC3_9LAMI